MSVTDGAIFWLTCRFREFAAERLTGSSWTEKIVVEALKDPSNDICFNKMCVKMNMLDPVYCVSQ